MDIEQKEKISKTKNDKSNTVILNAISSNIIPKQSDIQLAIPSHRKKPWCSFEEYKTHIENKKTIDELCAIYSKHLVSFYTALVKGRINISKEQFLIEYDNGISLNQISQKYNIPREHITYLREYFGVKRKGATFIKRLKNEVPLTQTAKDILIGSALGDGHISPAGYLSEKHSPKQYEYLKWKASFLKSITTNKSWNYFEYIDDRSGSLIKTHTFRTTTHSFLCEIRSLFYKDDNESGKSEKIIPKNFADLISNMALAVWFMDDGKTDWQYRHGKKISSGANPQSTLCTECFSYQDNLRLSKILKDKYNLDSIVNPHRRLAFTTKSSMLLHKIIRPYCHSDLLYKIDEQRYLEKLSISLIEISKPARPTTG